MMIMGTWSGVKKLGTGTINAASAARTGVMNKIKRKPKNIS